MPTLPLKVQANGRFTGWSAIVGGSFGYDCVDDSDGVTNDGDGSYVVIPTAPTSDAALLHGTASFPLFLMAEGWLPMSLTITVAAKRSGAGAPGLQIGFARGGAVAFSETILTASAVSYTLATRTFSVNPFTGAPWAEADIHGLEACVQTEIGFFGGNNRVSLVSGSITGTLLSNWMSAVSPAYS